MAQSALEIAAIAARNKIIPINTYNNEDKANNYTATHTRALSDTLTPNFGKGSGEFLDIDNYAGVGSELDINGNQSISVGSGRNKQLALNGSTWGFGPKGLGMENYAAPDISANKGQVTI